MAIYLFTASLYLPYASFFSISRRVRILCAEGKIDGVIRKGKLYMIPENATKPKDGRFSKNSVFDEIEYKRERLRKYIRKLLQGIRVLCFLLSLPNSRLRSHKRECHPSP